MLACGLSWSYWLGMAALGLRVAPGSAATHLPGLLGPGLAAAATAAWFGPSSGDGSAGQGLGQLMARCVAWPRSWGRACLWALSPLLAGAVVFGAQGLLMGRWPAMEAFRAYPGLPADWPGWAVVGTALLLNGFGEELGWRGFLLPRLAARLGPRRACVAVAVAWGLWHLPLFWVHAGMAAMVGPLLLGWAGGLLAGSLVLGWLYCRTQSVLVVALWHTAFNFMVATPPGRGAVAIALNALVALAAVWVWRRGFRQQA